MKVPYKNNESHINRSSLYIIILGATIMLCSIIPGKDIVYTGLIEGFKTRQWPSVTSDYAQNGTVSLAKIGWFSSCERTQKKYSYIVDGKQYWGNDYDVHGHSFLGNDNEISTFRSMGKNITVYYNPEDPSQSILKKGISLNISAMRYIRFFCIGLTMVSIGAVLIIRKQRELKKYSYDSNKE